MPHKHKVNDKHKYNCNKILKKMKKYFVWEKFETKTTACFFFARKGKYEVVRNLKSILKPYIAGVFEEDW